MCLNIVGWQCAVTVSHGPSISIMKIGMHLNVWNITDTKWMPNCLKALQSPLVVTGTCSLILTKGLLMYNSFQSFKNKFINCYGMVYYKFCRTKLFAVCLCRRNGEQERRWKWRSPPRTDWHRNKRSQFIMLHHNYRACHSLSVSLCVNCLLLISVIKMFINIM